MTSLESALHRIAADLERSRVDFALIGGLLATVRLTLAGDTDGPVIDLLFASSGIEPEIVAGANPVELIPGLTLKVARIDHLIALKVLSRDDMQRPQDLVDLRALLRVATDADVTRAREALGLITARGYDRGRELVPQLESLLGQSGRS